MSQAIHEPVVPKGGVFAAAALILFALASVTTVRLTGVGEVRMTLPAAVESRDFRFEDGKNGAVLVYDASNQQLVDTLAPGSNGFIRVVLRGLARERKLGDIGSQPPFRLTRFVNGQITLTDTSTGKQIDLDAFGSANTAGLCATDEPAGRRRHDDELDRFAQDVRRALHGRDRADLGNPARPCRARWRHRHQAGRSKSGCTTRRPASNSASGSSCGARATVVRGGPLDRLRARIEGYLELTELYEVSFSDGRAT